jgi:nucleotide-binding universal stress UspA family protein
MFTTILVPLDGSPIAERALPHATALARATGARLALIRAAQEHTVLGLNGPMARVSAMEEAESYLATVAARLRGEGFSVDTGVFHGGATEAIPAEAEIREANLIVMATHGWGGLGRLHYGNVAETILRRTTVPILLVRAWARESRHDPFVGQPRVLVPLDGSPFAEAALPVAAQLSRALGGELVLLHAVSPFEQVFMPETALADFPAREEARGKEARTYLHALASAGTAGDGPISFDVRLDVPTLAIEDAAREHRAALVVMATHGRTALGRLALGSVADAVLQHSRVPLLLVRPRHRTAEAAAPRTGATAQH